MKHPIYALTDEEVKWILSVLFKNKGNKSRKGYEEWQRTHKFVNGEPADKDLNGLRAYLAQHFVDMDEAGVDRFKYYYKQSQGTQKWKLK